MQTKRDDDTVYRDSNGNVFQVLEQFQLVSEMRSAGYIVVIDGVQWGNGPRDLSGCSLESFPTREAALSAVLERTSIIV